MHKYLIIGVQGSGKGTQAAALAQELDLTQISVGEIFRWHVQNHTKLGAQVRRTMDAGKLVDDAVVDSVIRERLQQHDWNYGFILDGFPRNVSQAQFLLESYDLDAVIHLDMPDSEVRARVLSRRLCSSCGLDYNVMEHRPAEEGRCDACGGELVVRKDDTEEALQARLKDFHDKTDPVLELLGRRWAVVTVDARADRATVTRDIRAALHLPAAS
jgi:adenylate kinase